MFVLSENTWSIDDHNSETRSLTWWKRITWLPYIYILPAIVLLVTWIYKPLIQTMGLSFSSWNLLPTAPKTPVGLENYTDLLKDDGLGTAAINTLVYTTAAALFSIVLPILLGLISNKISGTWKRFYHSIIFIPVLVTPVASAAVWTWIFDGTNGAIPITLRAIFHWDIGDVFTSQDWAIAGIIIIVGWAMLGFGLLVVSAGIAGISPDYAEAASTEGAGTFYIIRRITLPLLSPTIVFLTLMTILLSGQWSYPMIDIITHGGPIDATTNVYYLLFELGFQSFNAGKSGAAGTLFFIAYGLIALILVWLSNRVSFYDD